jgi:hypothetical protein
MTILKYGAYVFPENSTFPSIRRSGQYNAAREKFALTQEWTVRTEILGSGESDLTTKIGTFEAAMVDGNTLALYQSNGTTLTPHVMLDCRIIGGPSYPENTGPEYAVWRTAEVTFQGVTYYDTSSGLSNFQETVTRSGGGPVNIMVDVISGPARRHQVIENAAYFASQSGSAISTGTSYPQEPGPLFPGSLLKAGEVSNTPTVNDGKTYRETRWRYQFGSSQPLIGLPNEWAY